MRKHALECWICLLFFNYNNKNNNKNWEREREIEISDFSHWLMFFSAFAICIQSQMVVWSLVSDDVAVADDDDYNDEDDEVLIAIETWNLQFLQIEKKPIM